MSVNPDSVGSGSGEFSSHVKRDEPLMTGGHQPGKLVGNDAAPEFHAETLPAGTAPADRTFKPNPTDDIPQSGTTAASDTIGGATSADVHTGLGHPGSGQTSSELRHDGKDAGGSLEGRGAAGVSQSGINAHDPQFANQRALNDDNARVGRSDVPSAEERLPEGAETVAAGR